MGFISKLGSFFNWENGKEFNITTLGKHLKQHWLSILLIILFVVGVLYAIKLAISFLKDLGS